MLSGVWSFGGRTKIGRINLLPEKREYQYFLIKQNHQQQPLSPADLADLLVAAAEDEVEEDEEESHARSSPDADVEPGVVREYLILVVAGELVKTRASHSRLVGEVPSAQLVAHAQHIISPKQRLLCQTGGGAGGVR